MLGALISHADAQVVCLSSVYAVLDRAKGIKAERTPRTQSGLSLAMPSVIRLRTKLRASCAIGLRA